MRKYVYYLVSIFELLTGLSRPFRQIALFLRAEDPADPAPVQTFHLRRAGLDFSVRGKMDLWSVKETFLDRFYEKVGVPVGDGWTVLDIGAGIGEFTLFALHQGKGSRVFAFEPFPESFSLLQKNIRQNKMDGVVVFQQGIWSESGKLALDISQGEPLQLRSQAVAVPASQHVVVDCISIGDLFQNLNLSKVDLVKLDCEGAEYPILYHCPDELFERIDRIVMEYHDSAAPNCHSDLVQFLKAKGYRVHSVPNVVHRDIGYLFASRATSPRG
jgi:FkbM family methyltransferase